jgi:hypothetical protein
MEDESGSDSSESVLAARIHRLASPLRDHKPACAVSNPNEFKCVVLKKGCWGYDFKADSDENSSRPSTSSIPSSTEQVSMHQSIEKTIFEIDKEVHIARAIVTTSWIAFNFLNHLQETEKNPYRLDTSLCHMGKLLLDAEKSIKGLREYIGTPTKDSYEQIEHTRKIIRDAHNYLAGEAEGYFMLPLSEYCQLLAEAHKHLGSKAYYTL